MEQIPLCTNCKRVKREACDFIGDDGKQKKTCKKCRDKGKRYKKTQEQIDQKNEKARQKQYYKKYREAKIADNKKAFLKRNAENAKKWREENREHVIKYNKNLERRRIYDIKRGAERREISWNSGMTDEVCENMISLECFYCGFISLDKLNGIDRVDNKKGYSVSNCVPCCYKCNKMKGTLDYITYINRCKHISFIFTGEGELHPETWPMTNSITCREYKQRALRKKLDFDISIEYYCNIVCDPCYYCKNENSTGLDRVFNNTGYIMSNVVCCCSECNYMKFDMGVDEFISCCNKVCKYSDNINTTRSVDTCLKSITKRDIRDHDSPEEVYVIKTPLERNIIKKESHPKKQEQIAEEPQPKKQEQITQASQPKKQEQITKEPLPPKPVPNPEEKIFAKLGDEIIIEMLTMKGEQTTQEVSDYIRNKYYTIISRHKISKLYTGIYLPSKRVQNSIEYKNAMEKTTKRVYNKTKSEKWIEAVKEANVKRKLTDDEIIEIMNKKKTAYSAKELGERYKVCRSTVNNVWTGKMLPKTVTDDYIELITYKRIRVFKKQ